MYPESFIKELENTVQLSDLIGRKITLKNRGRDFVACCPFHHEKTPSFSVVILKEFIIVLVAEKVAIYLLLLWKWKD